MRHVGAGSSAFRSRDSLLSDEWQGVGALCRLPRARAHAGLGTRRVRARARAPRLQPSARSRLRCHSQLPGAAAASPESGALSAGPAPLAPSQEDELEEDAWARPARPRVRPASAPAGAMGKNGSCCCCPPPARARLEPRCGQPPAAGPRVTLAAPGSVARARGHVEEPIVQ